MEIESKYLIKETSRHGRVCYYYRRKPHKRIRIKAEFGTPEFAREFIAADEQSRSAPSAANQNGGKGSLREIITRYFASPEFHQLEPRTQQVRRLILDKLCLSGKTADRPAYGEWPAGRMEPRHVRMMRDENADRPEAANGIVKALRQVFAYAIEAGMKEIRINPARDVKYLKSEGEGHHAWTIEEVEQFERRHPVGTMPRLALALLLYLGQRRADVPTFGPAMVRDGWISFTQTKNRRRKPVRLSLPIIPELQKIIDATEGTGETWLVNGLGKSFTANGFGNWFADRCVEAGVPGRAHGLRKAAASRLAELGCSEREIMAITGHTTSKEVDRYTKAARQKVLARSAMDKVSASARKPRLKVVA